ncbi:MAG TPA: M14-type cytosolic carboxypeptidase, partial [Pirellulaceae bacterium]|nr:M14-type cytosolic carboxypeptidase [Pirellulaceae bacterium]
MARGAALVALVLAANAARGEITVTTEFEGGSAKVLAIDQEKKMVRIMPAGDPERGWPCWWYFRVDGLKVGDKLSLELVPSTAKLVQPGPRKGLPLDGSWAVPFRATFSTDAKTWRHTDPGRLQFGYAIYNVPVEAESLWLAWGPPFTPQDAAKLVKEIDAAGDWAESFEL